MLSHSLARFLTCSLTPTRAQRYQFRVHSQCTTGPFWRMLTPLSGAHSLLDDKDLAGLFDAVVASADTVAGDVVPAAWMEQVMEKLLVVLGPKCCVCVFV